MQDPQASAIFELLDLASEVKTRLRHLETVSTGMASGTRRSAHLPGEAALARVRNHLELALQALGSSRRPSEAGPALGQGPGLSLAKPEPSQDPLRRMPASMLGKDSEPAQPLRPTADPANPLKITGYYSSEVEDALRSLREAKSPPQPPSDADERPGLWVKNRVDEIHRALSTAFGEDDRVPSLDDDEGSAGPPQFVGSTDALSIPELIGFFQLQAKTGILTIEGESETFTLEYLRGELVHVASSASPDGERLGETLVRLGHVTEEQLEEFLAQSTGAERLGELLRRGDVISDEAVSEALQSQVQSIFHRLCAMSGCSFAFREGLQGEPQARARYNVTRLLLESARQRDESHVHDGGSDERIAS
ncbi:MAG: DUF4388 domain-containing protein [Planctomycetota bacterium]